MFQCSEFSDCLGLGGIRSRNPAYKKTKENKT